MELSARGGGGELGARAEEEGEGELVGPGAAPRHAGVEGKGVGGGGGVGGAADDGVPHEEVGAGDVGEELVRVGKGAGDGDRGGEDELAESEGVGEEAPDEHASVDLLQSSEGAAPSPYTRLVSLVPEFP